MLLDGEQKLVGQGTQMPLAFICQRA